MHMLRLSLLLLQSELSELPFDEHEAWCSTLSSSAHYIAVKCIRICCVDILCESRVKELSKYNISETTRLVQVSITSHRIWRVRRWVLGRFNRERPEFYQRPSNRKVKMGRVSIQFYMSYSISSDLHIYTTLTILTNHTAALLFTLFLLFLHRTSSKLM